MDTFQCPKRCTNELTEHEFIAEHGEYNEIYEVQCTICGHAHKVHRHAWLSHQLRNEIRPSRAYLTHFPYIEPQTGVLVHSKEHRDEVWKSRGLKVWDHDGDESGWGETEHRLKERYRDRDPAWRDLRRKMGG